MNRHTASYADGTAHAALSRRLSFLRCPDCRSALTLDSVLHCVTCGRVFAATENTVDLAPLAAGETRGRIETFWGDIYKQWYAKDDASLTAWKLRRELVDLEDLFRVRRHLPGREVRLDELAGREMLEIGSGAGGHSALFRSHGARMTSLDVTPDRAFATGQKLRLLDDVQPGDGLAIRGDAQALPFADNSFDLVYSNGVLHHAPDTNATIEEVRRVLKPGRTAALMLYSRHSALYWLRLLPFGILSGKAFRMPEAEWLGYFTEGRPKFAAEHNPITRVYSAAQLRRLLAGFENVTLRKFSFTFGHLPMPRSESVRSRLLPKLGYRVHAGGRIVYGAPIVPETALELALGPVCGYAWAITARKPL